MSMSTSEQETLEMALSFGMNPETSEPLTATEREAVEARLAQLKGEYFTADQAHGAPERVDAVAERVDGGHCGGSTTEYGGYDDQMGGSPLEATEYPVPGDPMQEQLNAIQAQLAALTGGGQPHGLTIGDVLDQIDPRDSEAALALFQWLVDTKRLGRVGTLDGGGYLLHYSEPKGSTKAGYTPGKTQGGRMVDQAVEKAKASGAKPANKGMCPKCYSVVVREDDGTVALDDASANTVCSGGGGAHDFHA